MFKKLVTNLPYSPGLLNQVSFYTHRLKQEEFIRRLGLIFGILALLLNMNLAIFAPEASVLASPANDVVSGGIYGDTVKHMQDAAIEAMRNSPQTRAIYQHYGITEADIRATTISEIDTKNDDHRSVGRQSFGRGSENCTERDGASFCERSMHAAYNYRDKKVRALVGVRQNTDGSGDPWFALIESCGNVVVRKSKDEDLRVKKLLAPGQSNTAKPGDIVDFRIKISAENENGAQDLTITDTLPEHTQYIDHSPKDLFDTVKLDGRSVILSTSRPQNGLGPYETRVIEIAAQILESAPIGQVLCNQVTASSSGDTTSSNSEPCVTVDQPTPEPACTYLKMIGARGINKVRTFEAKVDADQATIEEFRFDFGDGQSEIIRTSNHAAEISHTYDPGSYTASVSIATSAGMIGGSDTCTTQLIVDEPVADPSVTCDYIKLIDGFGVDRAREFEVAATPHNGASISDFIVTFGDGQQATLSSDSNRNTTEHIYANSGTYQAQVIANTSVGEVTNSTSCILNVEVEPEPCIFNPDISATDASCIKPADACEYNTDLQDDDPACIEPAPSIVRLKQAENLTQNITDAHNTTAQGGDSIRYTLVTENDGTATQEEYVIKEDLGDVLQYADIVDLDGGQLSDDGFVVQWPATDIAPGTVIQKIVTVKIKSPVPNTPVSASDPLAFDLKLENSYGNNVSIKLPASVSKQVEQAATSLPETGAGVNALVSALFIGLLTYFYFRNRLISKELRMIKKEFSGGVI